MKKLFRSLLAVMLIAMMALSFTSCAKPESVESKLKEWEYDVELIYEDEEIKSFLKVMTESAEEIGLKLEMKTPIYILSATCASKDCHCEVTFFWFESKMDCQDTAEAIEDYLAEIEKMFTDVEFSSDPIKVATKGKIAIFGNGDAFDDACDIIRAR